MDVVGVVGGCWLSHDVQLSFQFYVLSVGTLK